MRKILGSIAVAFALLVVGTVPAQAETPSPSVSSSITDKSGKIDTARLNLLVKQVQDETDYELYVYVTDSLSGMSGAQWAVETAKKSGLNSTNAVLFVIATQDRKYGSAYPTGSSLSSKISTVESAAIPAMKSGDWNGAVEAYGNKLIESSHAVVADNKNQDEAMGKMFSGFFGFMLLLIEILAGAAVLALAFVFGRRGILSALKTRKENKLKEAEVAKLRLTLPGEVSKIDSDLNAVNERISFVSAMDGEKIMEDARKYAKSASTNLQSAILFMGEGSSATDRDAIRRGFKMAHSCLRSAKADVASAQKVLDDIKEKQESVNAKAEELKATVSTMRENLVSADAQMEILNRAFDAEYVEEISYSLGQWKMSVAELNAKVSGISATTDFPKAKKAVGDAVAIASKVKAWATRFDQDVIAVNEFKKTRDVIVARHLKTMEANDGINGHERISSAYAHAVEALAVVKTLDGKQGNPGKELGEALTPVDVYLSTVKALNTDKRMVTEAKKVAVSQLAQKWGEVDTLTKSVKEHGIAVSASEKVALSEAVVLTSGKFKELRAKVNTVETYDTKAIVAATEEVKAAIAEVDTKTGTVAVKVATVEHQKAEERRQEEERQRRIKAEADAREAERRRKKRQEEEEEEASRRRRNSYSSSSSSSYSSSYSDYGSSSSSFSGSGGSFGDSGSGGSF